MKKEVYISDIVANNLCVGCGSCTNSSGDVKYKMMWDENGFLAPKLIDGKVEDANLALICPFNPSNTLDEDTLGEEFFPNSKFNFRIGKYLNTYVGYASSYRESSSSGGIATFIFQYLLSQKIVDYLFIVREFNGTYNYQFFSSAEDIKQISKTRYIPVTMEELFLKINSIDGKIAVSAVACFAKAIRLKQHYQPELKEKIPFIVGIICGGLKSKYYTDFLAQNTGINSEYTKQEYRLKDASDYASAYSFGAIDLNDKTFKTMKMKNVGDMWGSGLFKNEACDFCNDVLTELADISLGDAWLQPYVKDGLGTSIIITRSELADSIVRNGIIKGELKVENIKEQKIIQSQAGSFSHRQEALKYRISKRIKSGNLVPNYRNRLMTKIPFEYKLVQKKRAEIRKDSIDLWIKYKNISEFNPIIREKQANLKKITKRYHQIQKIRRLLKLKTMNILRK